MKRFRTLAAATVILAMAAAPWAPVAASEGDIHVDGPYIISVERIDPDPAGDSPYIHSVEGIELGPAQTGQVVLGKLLDELPDNGPTYEIVDGRLIFRTTGSLSLRGSGTRQIVIPQGARATLTFYSFSLDAGDRPAIVVEPGAELTIYLRGENRLRTSGPEPAMQIAPDALVIIEHGSQRDTLTLDDAGHDWHTGSFSVSSPGVRYTDPESGGFTDWTGQPAGAIQVENAYRHAVHRRRPGEPLTLELHNYPSLTAQGMGRLGELSVLEGGELEVMVYPAFWEGVPIVFGFTVWPDTPAAAMDLDVHQSSAATLAIQEALKADYPQRTCKVIRVGQEGALPGPLELSFHQHVPQVEDPASAFFYLYNPADGSLSRLHAVRGASRPGYLYDTIITTSTGGYLVMSDGVLSIF